MRERKMRAWVYNETHRLFSNTPEGTGSHWEGAWIMVEVLTIHLERNTIRGRYIKPASCEGGTGRDIVDVGNYKIGDKCIVSEYTGRDTEIFQEIYEGDILSANYAGSSMGKYQNEVVWNKGECAWNFAGAPLWAWEYMEVVGNRWENPELLKK